MQTTIFGGQRGPLFQDYLLGLRQGIGVQLEAAIKAGLNETEAKAKIKNMFLIKELHFDTSNGSIRDTNSDQYHDVPTNGGTRKALMKRYSYSVPFTGDGNVIHFRPETFHGFDRTADISKTDLTVTFRSEENNQPQFENFRAESIGSLHGNCQEINKEIIAWNSTQLIGSIDSVYATVIERMNQTKEFNRKNNIR